MGVLVLAGLIAVPALGQGKRVDDATRHANDAATVFREIMGTPDKAIPKELIDKASAIAVFPGAVKAAFVIGGRGGQGVISRRTSTGWSAPVYYNLGGASFGPQIGAEKTDFVLLIMNDDGLKGLMSDKFEMGGEAEVAAGPVGRTASATTDAKLKAGILSYSRSKGAFIGAALKGSYISPDNDLNEAFYGKKADALLNNPITNRRQIPASVRIFPQTLAKY